MTDSVLRAYQIGQGQAREFLRSRDLAHRVLMRGFPDGLGASPRAAVGLLWRLDARTGTLWVQASHPFVVPDDSWRVKGEKSIRLLDGRASYSLSIACQKTPPSPVPEHLREAVKASRARTQFDQQAVQRAVGSKAVQAKPKGSYRSKLIVVPEEERESWFIAKLGRAGFQVVPDGLQISPLQRAHLGRRRGAIPFVDVTFEAEVMDRSAATRAVAGGVGKGANYGLGLLLQRP